MTETATPQPIRPIRTVLNVPGDQLDRVRAAASAGSDAVWIDLEEPRTPFTDSQRAVARDAVGGFLRSLDPVPAWPRYFVRVQAIDTGRALEDMEAVVCPALTAVVLPKVEGPEEIWAADALLTGLEVAAGLPPGQVLLYPILETAQALRNAYEIANASERVAYMGGAVSRFGDIVQALGYVWTATGTETLMFRSKALIDARAGGVPYPITGNWGGDLDDIDGLRAWAEQGRDLGYRGTMTSHPPHVPILNEIYSPTVEEVAYWRELDQLATEAEASDSGPILHGDPNRGEAHVVHIAHVGSARQNLAWAEALRELPSPRTGADHP